MSRIRSAAARCARIATTTATSAGRVWAPKLSPSVPTVGVLPATPSEAYISPGPSPGPATEDCDDEFARNRSEGSRHYRVRCCRAGRHCAGMLDARRPASFVAELESGRQQRDRDRRRAFSRNHRRGRVSHLAGASERDANRVGESDDAHQRLRRFSIGDPVPVGSNTAGRQRLYDLAQDGKHHLPAALPGHQVRRPKDGKRYTVTGTGQAFPEGQGTMRELSFRVDVTCP